MTMVESGESSRRKDVIKNLMSQTKVHYLQLSKEFEKLRMQSCY